MVFRKGERLPRALCFYYNGEIRDIVYKASYLGVVFTGGESLSTAQSTLAGQAQNVLFKLNKYLYKFTYIPPRQKLDLFDKLVMPILNYSSEILGFTNDISIERVNLKFCKRIRGVKKDNSK